MYIFKFCRHLRHCLSLATSKAKVRYMYDMSMNKQALSCEKYIRIMFQYFKYSLTFSSQVLFGVWNIQYLHDLYCVGSINLRSFVTPEINTR